ncbi:MAG TPA: hypothetical protein VN982_13055 [Candidatus Dormibacteraeota bacterium]|nr:hypothetical protein [Candidatus Dormibacteraeota bacterium]
MIVEAFSAAEIQNLIAGLNGLRAEHSAFLPVPELRSMQEIEAMIEPVKAIAAPELGVEPG